MSLNGIDPKFEPLAFYNAERSRGILHAPEYDARMAELQAEWDEIQRMPIKGRRGRNQVIFIDAESAR